MSLKNAENQPPATDPKHSTPENSKGGYLLKKLPVLRLINTLVKTDITFIQITLNFN